MVRTVALKPLMEHFDIHPIPVIKFALEFANSSWFGLELYLPVPAIWHVVRFAHRTLYIDSALAAPCVQTWLPYPSTIWQPWL